VEVEEEEWLVVEIVCLSLSLSLSLIETKKATNAAETGERGLVRESD
jgi:hypothetical protein